MRVVNGITNGVYIPFLFETWKKCRICGEVKPLDSFPTRLQMKDGLNTECKACGLERSRRSREAIRGREKDIPPSKVCRRCRTEKKSSEFYANPSSSDGLTSHCKACCLDNQHAYLSDPEKAEKQKRRRRQHYLQNRDKYLAMDKEYRENTRERQLERRREYFQKHRDEINKKHKQYYAEHSEDWTRRQREDRKKNPKKYQVKQQNRRNIEGKITKEQWGKLLELVDYRCLACGERKELTVDHIVPVSSGVSWGFITNIQPLCKSCNSSKGAKYIDYRPEGVVMWAKREMWRCLTGA